MEAQHVETTGLGFDDMAKRVEMREAVARERLETLRKQCVGEHDTGQICNCRDANIIDVAVEITSSRPPNMVMFGPGSQRQDFIALLQAFKVAHSYRCNACGAMYHGFIIEEVRGYVPPDKRPEHQIPD